MSGQDVVAKFDVASYAKILLHGAKHPTCPVMGLLMGSRNGSEVTIQSIFPVLHGAPVGPLLDMAISMVCGALRLLLNAVIDFGVDCHHKTKTVILGIYFSNDRCDTDLAPVYIPRIVKSMTEKGHAEPCMVVQLKNSLLENLDMFCINGTQEGKSVVIDVQGMSPSKVNATIQSSTLLTQLCIRKFTDFEDYNNDIIVDNKKKQPAADECDFRNLYVDTAV